MAIQYLDWIRENVPAFPKGLCSPITASMREEFPELTRVRGHFHCAAGHSHPHWWLETSAGVVIDPTVAQFDPCGGGVYEQYAGPEPTGHCLDCGAMLYRGETFCNADCAKSTLAYLKSGGRIFVDGHDITGDGAANG